MSARVTEKPDVDTVVEEEEHRDLSGPHIRCPLCRWPPGKHDLWSCSCGQRWNTFDTGGVCPACLFQWTETQCLACHRWSPHSNWYEE
jgi:hypothetical protein